MELAFPVPTPEGCLLLSLDFDLDREFWDWPLLWAILV